MAETLARESALSVNCLLWGLWCLKRRGTHLLASRHRHLGGPTEERFQCAPDGAHLKRCLLSKFPRFRDGQQPKLREIKMLFLSLNHQFILTDVFTLPKSEFWGQELPSRNAAQLDVSSYF
jgi:hypothetical protein